MGRGLTKCTGSDAAILRKGVCECISGACNSTGFCVSPSSYGSPAVPGAVVAPSVGSAPQVSAQPNVPLGASAQPAATTGAAASTRVLQKPHDNSPPTEAAISSWLLPVCAGSAVL